VRETINQAGTVEARTPCGIAPETGRKPPRVGHFFCIDLTKTGDVSCPNDNFDPKAPENKNSALVWCHGGYFQPKPAKGRPQVFGPTISSAVIHDGLVYVSEQRGYLHCLDADTGQRYWEFEFTAGISTSPLWVDGKIYQCTDDGEVHMFAHGKALKKIGSSDMEESIQASPTVSGGVLYVAVRSKLHAIANGR
jgi:outer membrane protein assembly factor BamB